MMTNPYRLTAANEMPGMNEVMNLQSTLATTARSGTATIDFGGPPETFNARVSVTGLTWILGTSSVIACPSGIATSTHDPDDYWVEGITAQVGNIVPGVGFDIIAAAPLGTFGQYIFNWIGRP